MYEGLLLSQRQCFILKSQELLKIFIYVKNVIVHKSNKSSINQSLTVMVNSFCYYRAFKVRFRCEAYEHFNSKSFSLEGLTASRCNTVAYNDIFVLQIVLILVLVCFRVVILVLI